MSRPVVAYLIYSAYLDIEEGQEDQIEAMAFDYFDRDTHPEMNFDGWEYENVRED